MWNKVEVEKKELADVGTLGFTLKEKPKEETITSIEFANSMWPDEKKPPVPTVSKKSVKKKKTLKSNQKDSKTPRITKGKTEKKPKASGKENKYKDDNEI